METKESPLADKKVRMRFNRAMREKGVAAKACGKCFVVKGYEAFNQNSTAPDSRRSACNACRSAANQRRYGEHGERLRESARRWYVGNPGYKARWRNKNPERYRALARHHSAVRRARKAATTVISFTHDDMLADWEDHDLYGCVFCGGPFEEIEHILPLSRGGEHSLANIVPSCVDCNRGAGGKHARDPWEWLAERFPNLAPLLLDVDEA
ncbi:HNH endonuclease [Streptomyces nitrosporeus]|uniref:HNH endonuclease n=1 Tax=Streptomyces nitrosporeus TaxID=28894 RepID=A0A5J6FLI8_9ACTN|nr:HNH endonuclease [Streptomyces nitrosporeus]QEU75835.1 HNH endonuclease [Streptomyces nitrosporeus]GGY88658.1 hypothetical protein GCM10010327_19220 [Streptomyces nitrosporeus]